MKKIDIGNPTFEKLITEDNVYVDKTKYLYNLLTDGGTYYFCARPRRFGKTLTVNTLEEIFKGHRELFKGLYIDSTDYDWKEYPVIHIDFGNYPANSAEELTQYLSSDIDDIAKSYGIELEPSLYAVKLKRLIKNLSQESNVVILIDEYDKMLSSNIHNPEVEGIRDVLRGFFEIIKACYRNLRFVFITGVTKYAKLSVFSSMNNLRDISMSDEYATMFGYTQKELEDNFEEYIKKGVFSSGLSRDEYLSLLQNKYDGYRFSPLTEDAVFNPVSIGSFFVNGGKVFNNYWVETGSMKLLMDIAQKVNFNIVTSLEKPIVASNISSFDILEMTTGDVDVLKYEALLLQTGYLTIKSTRFNGNELLLGFPNEEVKDSYASNILAMYGRGDSVKRDFYPDALQEQFSLGNTQDIIDNLFSVYAAIPYRERET